MNTAAAMLSLEAINLFTYQHNVTKT